MAPLRGACIRSDATTVARGKGVFHEAFAPFFARWTGRYAPLRRRERLPIGHQAVLHCEETRPGTVRDADLGVDMLDMVSGRLARDDQLVRDLLVGEPARH